MNLGWKKRADFHVRVGRVTRDFERIDGTYVLVSRAIQIARTWRSHFVWRLANALGWQRERIDLRE